MTVDDVISELTRSLGPLESAVDTLKAGNPGDEVRGIATTFMPSLAVLAEAGRRGLNLVITHEAPFYHHRDDLSALAEDPVYQAKASWIKRSGINVFRLHDHMHRPGPDRIVAGLVRELGWEAYMDNSSADRFRPLNAPPLIVPAVTLGEMVTFVKSRLRLQSVRVVGDLAHPVRRVGLLPGYCGGGSLAIPYLREADLDLVIVGEGPEWETPEYVRDAVAQGIRKSLIVVGHGPSEEPGMKLLAETLRTVHPSVPVEFLAQPAWFQIL